MELKINVNPENIRKVCHEAAAFLKSHNLIQSHINDITLAIDEALTNIFEHGYSGYKVEGIARIKLTHKYKKVYIKITDSGKAYNFKPYQVGNKSDYLDSNHVGGFGISIIKKITDEVHYDRNYNENILVMVKNIEYESNIAVSLHSKSSIGYLENGIFKIVTKKDSIINLEDAKHHFQQYIDLIKEKPEKAAFGMIIDTRNIKMISKEAKDYYISQKPLGTIAFGIIINSIFGKWLGNYFISRKKNRSQHLKLFNSESEALFWIETFRNEIDTANLKNFR